MLSYFNSSEVIRITKLLKDILNEFESVKIKRARLCADSYSSHEENIEDSKLDPSSYYLFRFLDKSITITRDYRFKRSDVPHYMITCENWRPDNNFLKPNEILDVETNSYGSFDSLDSCIVRWLDFCHRLTDMYAQSNLIEVMDFY